MATDSELETLRTEPDPIRRGLRASELIEHYQQCAAEAAELRKQAIDEAHDHGMSYTDIADALGLTKGRISQIRASD
ncbi:sigma-70 RNA polymerase sigma factor region 4 domain-containing protein [Saccharomonospora iraqiensis]|uniref:sigma-70 family RNA polymerase sigma factor n=1 Tax=Saccharomonospora iraqiensis TaxID=52698 RepID=UPI00041C379B|nr:sigma-70 family RNA polymerase sigma factor [Saccharomonospora iraqiensis]